MRLSFEFAISVIEYCESLEQLHKYVIANQLLKSGTSIGANIREAQNPESRADFLHKLKVAMKETSETEYWLLLCKYSKNYPDTNHLLAQLEPLKKILGSSINTAKQNLKDN